MSPLDYPASHHVNAALGWLELGNVEEAAGELGQIADTQLEHPDVLVVRWRLHAFQEAWERALEIARRHVLIMPTAPEAWINQSYALHELGRTREAYRELRQVVERFRQVGVIPYNLACYACGLKLLDEAKTWLKRSAKILGETEVRTMALQDSDLRALHETLRTTGL